MEKKNKAVKGETTKLSYKSGERLAESKPLDEGIYLFVLDKMGKPFPKGWKQKPKKFPNRMTLWKALDTEDEVNGKEKVLSDFISLSPGALRRGALRLAYAAQYDLDLSVVKDTKKTNHPSVRANAMAIDKMLTHIKNEELTLRAEVTHEEWNGEKRARLKWLPPEELDDSETEESDEEETGETEDSGGAFGDDDADEDEKPKKGKKKAKSDEEDEDDDADADDDDSDGDDSDSDDEDGEADDDADADDSSDEDDADDDDDSDDEDAEDDAEEDEDSDDDSDEEVSDEEAGIDDGLDSDRVKKAKKKQAAAKKSAKAKKTEAPVKKKTAKKGKK